MEGIRYINLEYFFAQIYEFFVELFAPNGGGVSDNPGFLIKLLRTIGDIVAFLVHFLLPILIIICIAAAVYYFLKGEDVKRFEKNKALERIYQTQQEYSQDSRNSKWDRVVDLFSSASSADWRVAIIEADSMLEALVTSLGYSGETLGEKLKNIDKGHFPTLQDAWDAHNVRNRIAHEGMDFQLDENEKNRVFRAYEKVFMDAGFI